MTKIALLDSYLQRGGRLLLLLNPNPQPELRDLAASWWLAIDDGVVVDPEAHVTPNLDVPLVDARRNQFGLEDIYFPGATMVRPREGKARRGKDPAAGMDYAFGMAGEGCARRRRSGLRRGSGCVRAGGARRERGNAGAQRCRGGRAPIANDSPRSDRRPPTSPATSTSETAATVACS